MAAIVELRGIVSQTLLGAVPMGGLDDSDVNPVLATADGTDHDSGG